MRCQQIDGIEAMILVLVLVLCLAGGCVAIIGSDNVAVTQKGVEVDSTVEHKKGPDNAGPDQVIE